MSRSAKDAAIDRSLHRLFEPPGRVELDASARVVTGEPHRTDRHAWAFAVAAVAALILAVLGLLSLVGDATGPASPRGMPTLASYDLTPRFTELNLQLNCMSAVPGDAADTIPDGGADGGKDGGAGLAWAFDPLLRSVTNQTLTTAWRSAEPVEVWSDEAWPAAVLLTGTGKFLLVVPKAEDRKVTLAASTGQSCHRSEVSGYVLYEISSEDAPSILPTVQACGVPDEAAPQ